MREKTIEELLFIYSNIIAELKRRDILRTTNLIGEVGEHLAVEKLNSINAQNNIVLASPGTEGYDTFDCQTNIRYSIKAVTRKTTSVVRGLEPPGSNNEDIKLFDYMVIVKFNKDNYMLEQIYMFDWETFVSYKGWHSRSNGWQISLTSRFVNDNNVEKLI